MTPKNLYFTFQSDENIRLSQHFDSSEFACKCGIVHFNKISPKLIVKLEELRLKCEKPIHINSGYRCYEHNKAVGGKPDSQHLEGHAADIWVNKIDSKVLYSYAEEIGFDGIGLYDDFVHVDVRGKKARW